MSISFTLINGLVIYTDTGFFIYFDSEISFIYVLEMLSKFNFSSKDSSSSTNTVCLKCRAFHLFYSNMYLFRKNCII